MAFANAQELLACAKDGRGYGYRHIKTIEDAQKYTDGRLAAALKNDQACKQDRPWRIVDMDKKLDGDKPWIGFEFETGFDKQDDYAKVINFLWGLDHVALDREGTGKFPVEIAFPPMELDKALDESLLERTLQFIEDNGIVPALNPTTYTKRDVGCHMGISTKKSRAAGVDKSYELAQKLSKVLESLTNEQCDELYGRHALHWGTANSRGTYIELKMCKAIPHIERVRGYARLAAKCCELLDFFIDNPKAKVTNGYEFLSGKSDKIEV